MLGGIAPIVHTRRMTPRLHAIHTVRTSIFGVSTAFTVGGKLVARVASAIFTAIKLNHTLLSLYYQSPLESNRRWHNVVASYFNPSRNPLSCRVFTPSSFKALSDAVNTFSVLPKASCSLVEVLPPHPGILRSSHPGLVSVS